LGPDSLDLRLIGSPCIVFVDDTDVFWLPLRRRKRLELELGEWRRDSSAWSVCPRMFDGDCVRCRVVRVVTQPLRRKCPRHRRQLSVCMYYIIVASKKLPVFVITRGQKKRQCDDRISHHYQTPKALVNFSAV